VKKYLAVILVVAVGAGGFVAYRARARTAVTAGPGSALATGTAEPRAAAAVPPTPAAVAAAALAASNDELMRQLSAVATKLPPTARGQRIGQLVDAAAALATAAAADRSWDPAGVIARVGKDRAALFGWVRDQTALVPYRGALRDAAGVMMDRVGNSLDRSLLLAELLRQAGVEVRLANATLDGDAAGKLAAAWSARAHPVIPAAAAAPGPAADPAIDRLLTELGADPAAIAVQTAKADAAAREVATRAGAQIAEQAAALGALVPAAGDAAADPAGFADHWWVQARDGEAWIDLDPTQPAPGTALAPAAETFARDGLREALPEDRRHVLAIRVIGEVWHDQAREETVLVEHAFPPSSFYGQHITVTATPVDMPLPSRLLGDKQPELAARTALAAQTEWVPMIVVGGTPIVRFSVTDGGELFDLQDGHGNATRLARNIQKQTRKSVGGATDLLDQLPDQADGSDTPPAIRPPRAEHSGFTAAWVEYELRAPGAEPRIVRRTLFDVFRAPADRTGLAPIQLSEAARLDRGFALTGQTEVLPMFARIPASFFADRFARALVAARPALVELATAAPAVDDLAARLAPLAQLPGTLEALAVARFAWNPQAGGVFLDQLDVLTTRRRFAVDARGALRSRDAIDIVHNAVGVWPAAGSDPRAVRIAQGVADTVAESLIAACGRGPCLRGPNTSEVFATMRRGWTVVTDPAAPAIAVLPPPLRVHAARDLAAGYAIVVPPASAKGTAAATWWRVRAASGETLGEGLLGGAAMTEQAMLQFGIAGLTGYYCFVNTSGGAFVGCMLGATVGMIGGFLGLSAVLNITRAGAFLTLLSIVIAGESSRPRGMDPEEQLHCEVEGC
jgi:hypothetical protein